MDNAVYNALGADYAKGQSVVSAFRKASIEYRPSTQVWQIEDGWKLFLTTAGKASYVSARTILLANGAQERPVPFAGWTLPGVMTVGAAQILLKSGAMLPQGDTWIVGSGPLPLLYANQLLGLGTRVAGYLDTSKGIDLPSIMQLPRAWREVPTLVKGVRWYRELQKAGMVQKNISNVRAEGNEKLEYLTWQSGQKSVRVKADLCLVHEGVVPRVHETMALGCEHIWNEKQKYFAPKLDRWRQTNRVGLFVAGDAGGIGGWGAASLSGEIAALGIAKQMGLTADYEKMRRDRNLDKRLDQTLALRPFLDSLYKPPSDHIEDETIVCRCEEVTAGAIRQASRQAPPDLSAIKAATRCGMGPCQGRQCGYSIQALVAEVHEIPVSEVAFFNIRPPLKPVTLGEIASLADQEPAQ